MIKKKYLFHAVLLMPLFFSCMRSCGKKDITPTINIDISSPVEGLDSRYATSAAASRIAKLIYASLFELTDEGPKPLLAKSIENIDDRTFLVTLRDNLTFHDGSPITAEDVVYTYKDLGTVDVASPHADKFNYVKCISAKNKQQ